MTHVASNTPKELTEQELDVVSGGMTVRIGPVHISFQEGFFGIGVGDAGAWISGNTGTIGWHVGNSGGHIG